jgi:hypothetical protein
VERAEKSHPVKLTLMAHEFSTSYLKDSLAVFRQYKGLGERAMKQVTDEQLSMALDAEMDSIAQVVKHLGGNMRSRWTDFLTTDGEKADRNRDCEFESPPTSREEIMQVWNEGWALVFAALEPLSEADLCTTITIRGEAHSVMQAVNRQIAHYAYHIGQIVLIAKYFAADGWKSLTVPRGKSQEFLKR